MEATNQTMLQLKRGKRLRRLTKVLLNPQSQAAHARLKRAGIIVVLVLIAVDLAMFLAFFSLLLVQEQQVFELRSTSRAINRIMHIGIWSSVVSLLLSGTHNPVLRYLGQGGPDHTDSHSDANVVTDLQTAYARLESLVADLSVRHYARAGDAVHVLVTRARSHAQPASERACRCAHVRCAHVCVCVQTYHRGVYRGFTKVRELPADFGLRDIWEMPQLVMRQFYQLPNGTKGINANQSLWDAGNEYILATRGIVQNWPVDYPFGSNSSSRAQNDTRALFIVSHAAVARSTVALGVQEEVLNVLCGAVATCCRSGTTRRAQSPSRTRRPWTGSCRNQWRTATASTRSSSSSSPWRAWWWASWPPPSCGSCSAG